MKVLIINGSPKGKASNSLKLTHSFIEGFKAVVEKKEEITVDELQVVSLNIGACKGCFACWRNNGVCCQKDDMQMVIDKILAADVIVWSFPLFVYSVPGILKNLLDRQLPMVLPFMVQRADGYGCGAHPQRYNTAGKKHVVISTCGFYSAEGNYDGVTALFDHRLGKGKFTSIYCGQGELFSVKEVSARTNAYLEVVKQAGEEYANGGISTETRAKLETLLFPKETFERMADAHWGIDRETGKKEAADLAFTRRMASLYNPNAHDGKDRVLEMNYTDLGTTYQIVLTKEGSKVLVDGSATATTKVSTPFTVWTAIARNELNGLEALKKQMYSVSGDPSLLMSWDKFFGEGLPRGQSA